MATFQERLKICVDRSGMQQNDICRKINVATSTFCMYLSGKRGAKQDKIMAMAKLFNVNPVWLMGFDVDESPLTDYIVKTDNGDIQVEIVKRYMDSDELTKQMVRRLLGMEGD